MIGEIISAGARLLGGYLDRQSSEEARNAQLAQAARNEANQREFAQNAIQWRVKDAQAAGIHPLAALGSQGVSYSPVSVGDVGRPSMADTLGGMGQDISRAVSAQQTQKQRDETTLSTALSLENQKLQNDYLRVRIKNASQPGAVALPEVNTDQRALAGQGDAYVPEKDDDVKPIWWLGMPYKQHPGMSSSQAFEDNYSDAQGELWGMMKQAADIHFNLMRNTVDPQYLRSWIENKTNNRKKWKSSW